MSILAISLLAPTVSLASARKNVQKFYWDVYLRFTAQGPMPFRIESNLWWADKVYPVAAPPPEAKVLRNLVIFSRTVTDELDYGGYLGTYVLEFTIIWKLEDYLSETPGAKSITGKMKIHSGADYFEGMKGTGSVEVEYAWDETHGLIMIQRQNGILI